MFSIIQAAGWPIWFLLIASVIALALIIERLIYLRRRKILPPHLLDQVIREYREGRVDAATIDKLEKGSPLGTVLATGLQHSDVSRDNMKEAMEETGRSVALQMERFLTTIGTIATLAPLMGADGEKWVLEEHINEMLSLCGELLEPQNGFLVLNLYSMGLSALLARSAVRQLVGACSAEQFGELYFTDPFGKALPLGVYYRCAR